LLLAVLVSALLVGTLSATWFYRFTPISGEISGGAKFMSWFDPNPQLPPPVPAPQRGAGLLFEGELLSAAIGTTVFEDWGVALGAELGDACNLMATRREDVPFVGVLLPAFYLTKGVGPDYEDEGPVFFLSGRAGLGFSPPLFGMRLSAAATFESGGTGWKYGLTLFWHGIEAGMPEDKLMRAASSYGVVQHTYFTGIGAFVRYGGWRRIGD
jgi:hypothetical protein